MKKILKYLLIFILIFIVSGCKNKEENKIVKLDDLLYSVNYHDYFFDEKMEHLNSIDEFACSSVKNGNIYGRNFDFIFNDNPEFIVKVEKNENRHASIGVALSSIIHASDDIYNLDKETFDLIPNFTMDGINDAGVICSDNVVPSDDVVPITGTNEGKFNLHTSYVVRYVLDHADSADHAIKLLEECNIYGEAGTGYNLHFMIADKDKTYIVEFIDNKMVVEEKKDNEQIMTNFYNNLDELTEHAAGVERYKILQENYNEGNTFEGMWNLMQKVRYSKAYLYDNDWSSEFLTQSQQKDPTIQEKAKEILEEIKKSYWIALAYNQRVPANETFWLTTHNSIYDIKEKKLRVTIKEDYTKKYEFKLD